MSDKLSLSHVHDGQPGMVSVASKPVTSRFANSVTQVRMPSWVTDLFVAGDFVSKKGPVFATAIIAGTMAAKNTSSLIPLCHHLALDHVGLTIVIEEPGLVVINCEVTASCKTGVEMEALTGASIAALTLYDMCKGLTKDIEICETKVLVKRTA